MAADSSQTITVVICKGTLIPPPTEPPQTYLAAPAYSTPPLQETEVPSTHHGLLTFPPTPSVPHTALPATEPHRTRPEYPACLIIRPREIEALNAHQDHHTLPRTLHALFTLLLFLPARALTRAITLRNRT
jgi:hypothetical protein